MSDMTEAPKMRAENGADNGVKGEQNFDMLAGVSLRVSVEVGSASLTLAELLGLDEGSVVELDRQANDLLDIFANGTLSPRAKSLRSRAGTAFASSKSSRPNAGCDGDGAAVMMFEYLLRLFLLVPLVGGLAWGSFWLWRRVQLGLPECPAGAARRADGRCFAHGHQAASSPSSNLAGDSC